MEAMFSGGLQKVGGQCSCDRVVLTHIFTEVIRSHEKAQLLYAGCVYFTVA